MTTLVSKPSPRTPDAGQRVAFVLQARMGDVVAGIPTAQRLLERGLRVDWFTYHRFFELLPLEVNPVAVPEHPAPGVRKYPLGVTQEYLETLGYEHALIVQPGLHHQRWMERRRHIIELIAELAGEPPDFRPKRIAFPPNRQAESDADAALSGIEHFICIATGRNYSCANIADAYLAQLVQKLRGAYSVVCIGGEDARGFEGALHIDNLSPRASAALISRSRAYVGADTGTTWLAMAAELPFKACLLSAERMREGVIGFADYIDQRRIADFVIEEWSPSALADVILRECDSAAVQADRPLRSP